MEVPLPIIKIEPPYDPAIPLLAIYLKERNQYLEETSALPRYHYHNSRDTGTP